MIGLLERRLDAVGFSRQVRAHAVCGAPTRLPRPCSRSMAKRITIASYMIKETDDIRADGEARDLALVLEAAKSPERDHARITSKSITADVGQVLRTPKLSDVPYAVQMQPHLIVEFYSR